MTDALKLSIEDTVFYSIYDGVKAKKFPDGADILENSVVGLGYNFLLSDPMKMIDKFIPDGSRKYSNDLAKFMGQSFLFYLYGAMYKKNEPLTQILIKQLLVQGAELVYKQVAK